MRGLTPIRVRICSMKAATLINCSRNTITFTDQHSLSPRANRPRHRCSMNVDPCEIVGSKCFRKSATTSWATLTTIESRKSRDRAMRILSLNKKDRLAPLRNFNCTVQNVRLNCDQLLRRVSGIAAQTTTRPVTAMAASPRKAK